MALLLYRLAVFFERAQQDKSKEIFGMFCTSICTSTSLSVLPARSTMQEKHIPGYVQYWNPQIQAPEATFKNKVGDEVSIERGHGQCRVLDPQIVPD